MKNRIIKSSLLLILGLVSVSVSAQDIAAISSTKVADTYAYTYETDDSNLITTNAVGEIKKHIGTHLEYPVIAEENNIEGLVVLAVQINKEGTIISTNITSKKNRLMDEAVLQSIDRLQKVSPVYVNGAAKNYTVMVPVRFAVLKK